MTITLNGYSIVTLIKFHKVKDITVVVADTSSGIHTSDSERNDEYVVAWRAYLRKY